MYKIVPVFGFILAVFFPAFAFAQGSPNLQLRPLTITPPPPIGGPPAPPPVGGPTPGGTTSPPKSLCPYLLTVFGALIRGQPVVASTFGVLYPRAEVIDRDKASFLKKLKSKPNASSLSDSGKIKIAFSQLLQKTNGEKPVNPLPENAQVQVERATGRLSIGPTVKIDPKLLDNLSDADDIAVAFYKSIYQIMLVSNSTDKFFEEFREIEKIIAQNTLPAPPDIILGTDQGGFGFVNRLGFPVLTNIVDATAALNCLSIHPVRTVSLSPLIYLYPSKVENISVNFQDPGQISTAYPGYSLIQGFKVKANGAGQLSDLSGDRLPHDYLYYEFLKDNINYERLNIKYQVIVAGDKLEDHLFHALLPKLSLTSQELSDYQEDIKKELITHIPSHISHLTSPITHYQISLIQSSSLDYLIPLTVTPKPDTVIRNMIVVKKVETLTYPLPITHHTSHITHHTSPITHYSFPRQGFTLVENGITIVSE